MVEDPILALKGLSVLALAIAMLAGSLALHAHRVIDKMSQPSAPPVQEWLRLLYRFPIWLLVVNVICLFGVGIGYASFTYATGPIAWRVSGPYFACAIVAGVVAWSAGTYPLQRWISKSSWSTMTHVRFSLGVWLLSAIDINASFLSVEVLKQSLPHLLHYAPWPLLACSILVISYSICLKSMSYLSSLLIAPSPSVSDDLTRSISDVSSRIGIIPPTAYVIPETGGKTCFLAATPTSFVISDHILLNLSEKHLSAIVAHEMAHISLRHSTRRWMRRWIVWLLGVGAIALLSAPYFLETAMDPGDTLLLVFIACLPRIVLSRWLSTKHLSEELEADVVAATIIADSGLMAAAHSELNSLALLPTKLPSSMSPETPSLDDRLEVLGHSPPSSESSKS